MSATVFEPKAASGLHSLGLTVAGERLDQAAQRAAAEQWSYSHFLGYLLDGELAERHQRAVALNLQFARFPVTRPVRPNPQKTYETNSANFTVTIKSVTAWLARCVPLGSFTTLQRTRGKR